MIARPLKWTNKDSLECDAVVKHSGTGFRITREKHQFNKNELRPDEAVVLYRHDLPPAEVFTSDSIGRMINAYRERGIKVVGIALSHRANGKWCR